MRQKFWIVLIAFVVLLVLGVSTAMLLQNNNSTVNNTTEDNVNLTLNETNNTTANTTNTTTTKKSTTKINNKNSDPDYDPERDASHKGATKDNPITVQQSDGEYRYYGPGHYNYYAGDNHMSGGHYKEMNKRNRK